MGSETFKSAGKLIGDLIDARVGGTTDGETYRNLGTVMLRELRTLVATSPKAVQYLDPLVKAGSQPNGLTIATLNYDLSIEHAAKEAGVPCTTGVENWLNFGKWNWVDNGIRLLKLHGSINWLWGDAEEKPGQMPQRVIYVPDDLKETPALPAIVFGQRGKLRAEGPFLGLLGELEGLLSSKRELIVIGYSFRDEHVNEIILRWLSETLERRITVVDPAWPDRFPLGPLQDFRAEMKTYLLPHEWQDESFPPRLKIMREKCSVALQELFQGSH